MECDFPIKPVLEFYGGVVPRQNPRQEWVPMKCPFHGDEQASAAVNEREGRFMCHGCMERSEDAVGVVKWWEECGFRSAVTRCEGITGGSKSPVRSEPGGVSGLSGLLV